MGVRGSSGTVGMPQKAHTTSGHLPLKFVGVSVAATLTTLSAVLQSRQPGSFGLPPPSRDLEDEGDELFDALPVGRERVRVRSLQLPLLVLHLGNQPASLQWAILWLLLRPATCCCWYLAWRWHRWTRNRAARRMSCRVRHGHGERTFKWCSCSFRSTCMYQHKYFPIQKEMPAKGISTQALSNRVTACANAQ